MKFGDFQRKSSLSPDEVLAFAAGLEGAPAGLPGIPGSLLLPFHEVRELSWDAASGTGRIVAARRNRLDDWFYDCHFQGDPVMPGCWGVDAVWQALKLFAAWRGLAGCSKTLGMENVSFFGQIRPYDREVVYAVDVTSVEAQDGETLVTGKATVAVNGAQVYTIGSAQVATACWTDESGEKPSAGSVPDEPAKRVSWEELSAKTRLNRAEVIGLSRGTLVHAPGKEVGLLPSGPMLEIGRVEELRFDEGSGEGVLRASRENGPLEWFYPMTPGLKPAALSVDAAWQLCGLFLTWRGCEGIGRALGFERAEVFGEIGPDARDVRYEARIVRFTRVAGGDAFVRADVRVWADGRPVLALTNANVGIHKGIRYADFPVDGPMARGGKLKAEAA